MEPGYLKTKKSRVDSFILCLEITLGVYTLQMLTLQQEYALLCSYGTFKE